MQGGAAIVCVVLLLLAMPIPARAGVNAAEQPRIGQQALMRGVSVSGMWKFQPGDNAEWALPRFDDTSWVDRRLPGRWPEGGYPETNQLAWYRLTVKLDVPTPQDWPAQFQLALKTGKVMSAFEVYAGGKLIGGVGALPPLAELNYDRVRVLAVPSSAVATDGTLVLALRVWGGDAGITDAWGSGPYYGDFILGNNADLLLSTARSELPGLLASLLFIGFGIYHIYLYRRNRQFRSYLWLGLLAINIGIYGITLNQWKYAIDFSFLVWKKIEFAAIYIFPAVVIQMLWTLLDTQIRQWLRIYQATFVVLSLAAILIPGMAVLWSTLPYFQLWSLPLLILGSVLLIKRFRDGHPEARTSILGVMIFAMTCVNDLLIDLAQTDTMRLMPFGFVAIFAAMAVSLANRFTANVSRLEDEVAERTRALSVANKRLQEMARIDPLTKLLNRRGFTEEGLSEIQRVFRGRREFALMLMDIDDFKRVNDRFGHACGDAILQQLAGCLRGALREVDVIGRWGGEEFIILLPQTNERGASTVAANLRSTIAGYGFAHDGVNLSITATIGVSLHRKGESLDACMAAADRAMYAGKAQGRDQVVFSDSAAAVESVAGAREVTPPSGDAS